jgi:hypothetical protein
VVTVLTVASREPVRCQTSARFASALPQQITLDLLRSARVFALQFQGIIRQIVQPGTHLHTDLHHLTGSEQRHLLWLAALAVEPFAVVGAGIDPLAGEQVFLPGDFRWHENSVACRSGSLQLYSVTVPVIELRPLSAGTSACTGTEFANSCCVSDNLRISFIL